MDVSSKQCETAWDTMAELKRQIAERDIVIRRLKEDARDFPLSMPSLMRSHQLLSDVVDTLRECFTCPLCYEGLAKQAAVSLQCGHTFCQTCIHSWAKTSPQNPPQRPTSTKITTDDQTLVHCPECRTSGSASVRLYMLEEAIRLLARAEREREMVRDQEQNRRDDLEHVADQVADPQPPNLLED